MIITREQEQTQLQQRIFSDMVAENLMLREENSTLREQIAILEDRISELEDGSRVKQLEQRLTEQRTHFESIMLWTRNLFSNAKIPMACKLVIWQYYMMISFLRPQAIGEETQIGMEQVARALGINVATVRRATDKAEQWDILARRYETIATESGEPRKVVHITLNETVARPESIEMEKTHGGQRVRKCPNCGNEGLDNYTVRYCPCCNTAAWYGQPGLRADADVIAAQNAPYKMTHQTIAPEQDAFYEDEKQDDSQHSDQGENTRPTTSAVAAPLKAKISSMIDRVGQARQLVTTQKQDAQPASEQLDTEHTSVKVTASCNLEEKPLTTCHARYALNKHGQPAKGLEMITGYRECGCTRWIWSEVDQKRICASCYTPEVDR